MGEPGNTISNQDMDMMKISQTVLMGFGFLTIWGGVFTIAFDTDADRMQVIKGNTVEARDVPLELYDESGDIKARTKVKRATYKENDAILMAEEAIYISGKGFQASGTSMVYDINTGQGFIIGPASSLFNLKSSRKSDTQP